MVPVNRRLLGDQLYRVGLHTQTRLVYAESLREARQRAVELFRPKKRDRPFITVAPAQSP